MLNKSLYEISNNLVENDYVVIRGVNLDFNRLVNQQLLSADNIDANYKMFTHAKPFPYIVIENLFEPKLLELIYEEFDFFTKDSWRTISSTNENTHRLYPRPQVGTATQLFYSTINSGWFLDYLSAITGIKNLVPDPHFCEGGMHQVKTGGFFDVHVDFNRHTHTMLTNKLAMVTYLNKNWEKEFNGALELLDISGQLPPVEIWPEFGRTIIFQQGVTSLHGHPKLLNTPENIFRRSIVSYYYKNDEAERYKHGRHWTLYFQESKFKRWFEIKYFINYRLLPFFGGDKLLSFWRYLKKR